jgi:hypothetical protein
MPVPYRVVAAALLLLAAGCASPSAGAPSVDPALEESARSRLSALDEAVQLYYLDRSMLPASLEELTWASPGGGAPYLAELIPDPWGNDHLYEVQSDRARIYRITSAGPDGAFGTADDIQIGAIRGSP